MLADPKVNKEIALMYVANSALITPCKVKNADVVVIKPAMMFFFPLSNAKICFSVSMVLYFRY